MNKTMKIFLLMLILLLCHVAAAQTYSIRVQFNTNLREQASLDSHVLQSAPAGSILQVVGSFGRWLNISRDGSSLWMADWVNYSRVDSSAPAASQSANVSPANVDNCCFVDRQCQTEADWTNGYYAYKNGQCAAPVPSQSQSPPQAQTPVQPISPAPAQVDNCCFVDRQCQTEAEWAEGYYAYLNNQCGAPAQNQTPAQPVGSIPAGVDNCCRAGWQCQTELDWQRGWSAYQLFQCSDDIPMRIDGSGTFVNLVREAYTRLKRTSPRLYIYGITGFSSIREAPADGDVGYFDDSNTFQQPFGRNSYSEDDVINVVGGIAHEACHAHKLRDGTATSGWRNELPCLQKELEAYHAVDPTDYYGYIVWIQDIIDNIENPAYWWW